MPHPRRHPLPTAQLPPNRESITALVHGFYADVRLDPLLGPVFERALAGQWEPHLKRLVEFWSTIVLGTRSFRGNVVGKHMELEGITPAHFATWVRLWAQHTSRLFTPGVAQQLQQAAHGVARNLFRAYFDSLPSFAQEAQQAHHDDHGSGGGYGPKGSSRTQGRAHSQG